MVHAKKPTKTPRVKVTISLRPEIVKLQKKAQVRSKEKNTSRFYESSVATAYGLSLTMKKLEKGKIDINDAIEDLGDMAAVWDSNFEEHFEYVIPAKFRKFVRISKN